MSNRRKVKRGNTKGYRRPRVTKDLGTPELIRKRAEAAGGGDPALTSNLLDWLRCRGLIDNEQHKAGIAFARLYRQTLKRPDLQAQNLDRVLGGGNLRALAALEDIEAQRWLRFQRLSAALISLSRAHYESVREAVIFGVYVPKKTPAVSRGLEELAKELYG